MKRLSQAVSCGGGVSRLLDEGSLPISRLESSSTCVVDMTSGNSQALIPPTFKKWVDSVAQILHRCVCVFLLMPNIFCQFREHLY